VEVTTFGSEQYKWRTNLKMLPVGGAADPDGPVAKSRVSATENSSYNLPKASVTVIRGRLATE
jgi:hypothetical protein